MRIIIETADAAHRVLTPSSTVEQAGAAAVADLDGGPAPQAPLSAPGGAAAPATGAAGSDAGGPPAWLEAMLADAKRPLP